MNVIDKSLADVRAYYGKVLRTATDLRTRACCCTDSIPFAHRAILANIAPEILDRFYGCGSPIPDAVEGCTVLDLGCGSGRDTYLLSALVGSEGTVTGIDMTEAQLAVAQRHRESQARRFGLDRSNVEFRCGYIEDLAAAGIADASIDVVISNCAINLSPDKRRVFSEIFRVLKPGGELLFSDVFASRRLPAQLREDPVLLGECLGGAMYVEDFRRLMTAVGWPDFRRVSKSKITLGNPEVEARVGATDFWSMTLRAFKLSELEDICEDYGQVATYLGTIPNHPHRFMLDDHHMFLTGKPMLVCGNTAAMVSQTRLKAYFHVTGDRSQHFGPFDCETPGAHDRDRDGGCC